MAVDTHENIHFIALLLPIFSSFDNSTKQKWFLELLYCSIMTTVLKQYRVIAAIINKSVYHPIVKEKIIKIIQYYTQFLIAFYKNATKTKLDRLRNIQYIMSTCRKSIRFGRCLNHVYTASQLISKIRSSPTAVDLHTYGELSEELFNTVHFFLDSRMLLYRAGVLTTNETLMDNLFYIGDFGADLSVILHSTLKILHCCKQRQALLTDRDEILALRHCDSIMPGGDSSDCWPHDSTGSGDERGRSGTDSSLLACIDQQLSLIAEEQQQATTRLTIWSIQIISSGNYPPVNIWRRLFGADCPGTLVGLSGVLSSSLVLYDTISAIAESSFQSIED